MWRKIHVIYWFILTFWLNCIQNINQRNEKWKKLRESNESECGTISVYFFSWFRLLVFVHWIFSRCERNIFWSKIWLIHVTLITCALYVEFYSNFTSHLIKIYQLANLKTFPEKRQQLFTLRVFLRFKFKFLCFFYFFTRNEINKIIKCLKCFTSHALENSTHLSCKY